MLTKDLTVEVVEQTTKRLNRPMNMMDRFGIILASSDSSRVNQIHDGAVHVLKTGKSLLIRKEDLPNWRTSKPGLNMPIEFQGEMIGVIGLTGDPDEIWEFGELVKMNTEMMVRQAYLFEQSEWKQRIRDQLFHELIQKNLSPHVIEDKGKQASFKLVPPFQVTLINADAASMQRSALLDIIRTNFDEHTTLIGYVTLDQMYLLTTATAHETVSKKLQTLQTLLLQKDVSFSIATGSQRYDLFTIASSYQEARSALTLGTKPNTITYFQDVQTQALLHELPTHSKRQYYQSILENVSEKYIETLEHFFSHNSNIGDCAKSLFIHRNSLVYRLKKIHDSTGYDPQLFTDCVPLQIAIWLRRLDEHDPEHHMKKRE